MLETRPPFLVEEIKNSRKEDQQLRISLRMLNVGAKMEALGVQQLWTESAVGGQVCSCRQGNLAGSGGFKSRSIRAGSLGSGQTFSGLYVFAPLSRHRLTGVRAFSNDKDNWTREDSDDNWDPAFEIEVPADQRPVCSLSHSLSVVRMEVTFVCLVVVSNRFA